MGEKNLARETLTEWNKIYIETLIKELNPSGDVLQVGFGQGDAATLIQSFHPKHHTIVEKDPETARKARDWAAGKSNVTVVEESWKTGLPKLSSFDAVFFHDDLVDQELEILLRLRPADINFATTQTAEMIKEIEAELSHCKVHFSDEQIEEFFRNIGHSHLEKLPRFFFKLHERGQITTAQYEKAIRKYHLEHLNPEHIPFSITQIPDSLIPFAEAAFASHMKKGGRLTAFSYNLTSRFENPRFFDAIITNPNLEFKEKTVTIKSPKSAIDALVIMITKIS